MTKLFLCDTSGVTEIQYEALMAQASRDRKRRASSYPKREDAVCCLVAEALLRYAFPGKDPETIQKEPGGKPYWDGCHFNISHSGPLVAVAVGESPVGVDVECFRQVRNEETLAKRYFTPKEVAFAANSQERFLQIWTAKEARIKWDGSGLRTRLNSFCVLADPMAKTWHLPGAVMTLWARELPENWEPVEICKIVPLR